MGTIAGMFSTSWGKLGEGHQSKPFEGRTFPERQKEREEDHFPSLWLLWQESKHRARRTGEEAIVEVHARHRGGSARRNAHRIHSSGNRNSSSN